MVCLPIEMSTGSRYIVITSKIETVGEMSTGVDINKKWRNFYIETVAV